MHNPFDKQVQLNLRDGTTKAVNVLGSLTPSQYFYSLNGLNKSAHVYGVLYLASDEALATLPK